MCIASGKVVTGKVVVEGEPFEEGAEVVVIAADDLDTFELAPDEQSALLERIAEANQCGRMTCWAPNVMRSLLGFPRW